MGIIGYRLQVSFSTCTQLYSVQYSSKQHRGLQAWEYPGEPLWLNDNAGIIGNFERIMGSFWGSA